MSKRPGPELPELPELPDIHRLGAFLKEQRQNARLSLRQLSELAGVSNPYLSQIERGLKKPSAEILQQLARGLQVSAETLYVQAGILEEKPVPAYDGPSVLEAIAKDPALTDRQRAVLVDVYQSFTTPTTSSNASTPKTRSPKASTTRRTTTKEKRHDLRH
jgi:transcriptional regulator with XRE-family HTH domain